MMDWRVQGRSGAESGATLVEALLAVLLAVLLVAVCLAPAIQSLSSSATAQRGVGEASREAGCLQAATERTLAEQYVNLLGAASSQSPAPGSFTGPTAYSVAQGAECPTRIDVYILRYDPSLANPFASMSDEMLYVRAAVPGGASLGTVVIRR